MERGEQRALRLGRLQFRLLVFRALEHEAFATLDAASGILTNLNPYLDPAWLRTSGPKSNPPAPSAYEDEAEAVAGTVPQASMESNSQPCRVFRGTAILF